MKIKFQRHVQKNLGIRLRMYVSERELEEAFTEQSCDTFAVPARANDCVRNCTNTKGKLSNRFDRFRLKTAERGHANRISSKNNRAVWKERLTGTERSPRRRRFPRRPFTACTRNVCEDRKRRRFNAASHRFARAV